MKSIRFLTDSAPIGDVRKTKDGHLTATVRCARSGCQEYMGSELGLVDHKGPITVYRPEDVVFATDSLASYANRPITIEHPKEMVNDGNWKDVAVGHVGGKVMRDGDFVVVEIAVMDKSAVEQIEAGADQISMGYETPIEMRDGVSPDGTKYQAVQTGPIMINHLAAVKTARGGSDLRIGDSANNWGAAPQPTREATKETKMSDALKTIVVDGLSVQTTDAGAQAITKLQDTIKELNDSHGKVKTDLETKLADALKQVETKDGENTALKTKLADATSPKALADAAKARVRVTDAGKKAGLKEEDMEDMSEEEIKKNVVKKKMGDAASDMSDAQIDGAFAVLSDSKTTKQDDALGGGVKHRDSGGDPWAFIDADKKKES